MQHHNYQYQSNFLQTKFIFRQLEGVFIAPEQLRELAKSLIRKPKARRIEVIDESEEHIIKKPLSAYLVSDEHRRANIPELVKTETLAEQAHSRIPVYQYSRITGEYDASSKKEFKGSIVSGILLSVALFSDAAITTGNIIKSTTQNALDVAYGVIGNYLSPKSRTSYTATPATNIDWRQRIKGFLPAIVLSAALFFVITFSQFGNNEPSSTPLTLGTSDYGQNETTKDDTNLTDNNKDTNTDTETDNDNITDSPGALEVNTIPPASSSSTSNEPLVGNDILPVGGSGSGSVEQHNTSPDTTSSDNYDSHETTSPTSTDAATGISVDDPSSTVEATVPGQSVELLDTTLVETSDTALTIN